MNILGLDLSMNGTGICWGEKDAESLPQTTKQGDNRLVRIADAVAYYADRLHPKLAVIEGLPFGSNDRQVALVHGAARTELARRRVPFVYIYPGQLKLFATGDGKADKTAMVDAVENMCGWRPRNDDMADAWWLRRMGWCAAFGDLTDVTAGQAEILGRVQWPALVRPFSTMSGRVAKCRHGNWSLRNGDHWLHPFTLDRCDKPPK